MKCGGNFRKKPIKIKHASLERTDSSIYRSKCTVCEEGILPMRRKKDSTLSNKDNCMFCGQPFIYTDILPGRMS